MRMHITTHPGAVTAGVAILSLGLAGVVAPATARAATPACRTPAVTVYVANALSGTVTPIRAATNTARPAINVGGDPPLAIAITPNGKTAYVSSDTMVTPVNTATGAVGKAISVGGGSTQVIAITPNGKTVYALGVGSGTVTPISTRTNTAGPPIDVYNASDLAITPDGRTVYVVDSRGVIPIRTATNKAGALIPAGGSAITVTPNGKTAYVIKDSAGLVTPIRTATNRAGKPIQIPVNPNYSPWGTPGQTLIISTPDSKTVYAASPAASTVTPISTATNRAGKSITVGRFPYYLAITPNGRTLVVVNQDDTVTLINTATNKVRATIKLVTSTVWYTVQTVAITPDGRTAYVVSYEPNTVTPISLTTGKAGKPIAVGRGPIAVAISPAPPAHR